MLGKQPQSLRIGTCSWKYKSWHGLIYSDDTEDNVNNHYEGSAPLSIDRFLNLFLRF